MRQTTLNVDGWSTAYLWGGQTVLPSHPFIRTVLPNISDKPSYTTAHNKYLAIATEVDLHHFTTKLHYTSRITIDGDYYGLTCSPVPSSVCCPCIIPFRILPQCKCTGTSSYQEKQKIQKHCKWSHEVFNNSASSFHAVDVTYSSYRVIGIVIFNEKNVKLK